jgi:hypothetical protein
MAYVLGFSEVHGMYGILSEEGFEAVHPKFNKIVHNLKPMVDTTQQLERTFSHLMSSSNDAIKRITQEYNAKLASWYSAARPPTNSMTGRSRNHESRIIFETGLVGEEDEECLLLADGKYLIKREVCEFLCHSKVPKSWSRILKERDDLGNVKK